MIVIIAAETVNRSRQLRKTFQISALLKLGPVHAGREGNLLRRIVLHNARDQIVKSRYDKLVDFTPPKQSWHPRRDQIAAIKQLLQETRLVSHGLRRPWRTVW